jgi:hypothetical protein
MLTSKELKKLSESTVENTDVFKFQDKCKTIKVLPVHAQNPCSFTGAFHNQNRTIKQFEFWCSSHHNYNNHIVAGDILEIVLENFADNDNCICIKEIKPKT